MDGKWSSPKFVGHFSTAFDKVFLSEDSEVITLQSASNPSGEYYDKRYNLLVFKKDQSGDWQKEQMNEKGQFLQRDAIVSNNGKQISWVTE